MKRLSFEKGIEIFKNTPLKELKEQAVQIRNQKVHPNEVTFVLDSNPNYTNVCNADCSFCAFYRHDSAKDAYTKSIDEVMKHLDFATRAGITTVLLQGGLNPKLPLDYYLEIVKRARKEYPNIYPHFFTSPEIWTMAKVSGKSIREVLQALYDCGQRSLPGGGAEILSERVRLAISPKKAEANSWKSVHLTAHDIGFRSTATLLYGHVEEPEDILTHLSTIREMQDIAHQKGGKDSGFTAFIPWSYKRERTALRRKVKNWAGKDAYFRILSFARIFLDNFDHIQASWFSEGKDTGIEALRYGSDDFGGTILEENVHREANYINKTDHNGMLKMIREAGYFPVQRSPLYEIIRRYEMDEWAEVPEEGRVKEKDHTPILENSDIML